MMFLDSRLGALRSPLALSVLLWLAISVGGASLRGQTDPAASQAGKPDKKKERERKQKQDEPQPDAPAARRPYKALFGGASTETDAAETLDFTGTLSEVYDQNLLADVTTPDVSNVLNSSGFYTAFSGDVTYQRRGSRLQASATGGMNARYYSSLGTFAGQDYHVGAGLAARMTPRSTLRVDQAFSRAPTYLLGLFANAVPAGIGEPRPPSTDYAVNDDRSDTSLTSGEFSQALSPRSVVTLNGNVRLTHYLVTTPRGSGLNERAFGGAYVYRLNGDADLRFGYAFRQGDFTDLPGKGPAPSYPAEHNVIAGIDLHRALSSSRRTAIGIRAGSIIAAAPLPTNSLVATRQIRLLFDGSITHQMGETWQLAGAYRRGTGYVEGLTGPAFIGGWTLSLNGFVSPRADFITSLSYSTGEPSLVGSQFSFTTYRGDARFRLGLTERWALSAEYLYYFYDFSETTQLAPGIDPRVRRNSLRAGVSTWVPLRRR